MNDIENNDVDTTQAAPPPGYVDNVDIGLEMHLLIKDADTNETLVNQRG